MEFREGIDFISQNLFLFMNILIGFFNSARGISLNIPLSKEDIIFEIEKVLVKNSMINDVHIRLIISRE